LSKIVVLNFAKLALPCQVYSFQNLRFVVCCQPPVIISSCTSA